MLRRQIELEAASPADVDESNFVTLRLAAEKGLIADVEAWFRYRQMRNTTVSTPTTKKGLTGLPRHAAFYRRCARLAGQLGGAQWLSALPSETCAPICGASSPAFCKSMCRSTGMQLARALRDGQTLFRLGFGRHHRAAFDAGRERRAAGRLCRIRTCRGAWMWWTEASTSESFRRIMERDKVVVQNIKAADSAKNLGGLGYEF